MPQIPLRFGSDEQFARVKALFSAAGYHEQSFPDAGTGNDTSERFSPYSEENHVPGDVSPSEVFTGLFLRGASATPAQLHSVAGEQGAADLLALGMIEVPVSEPDRVAATVRVRPMFGLHVVSDHWNRDEGSPLADDVVYPPDIGNTVKYLSFIPTSPCQRFLEACGGSGVAALLAASRFAGHASSFDITQRSTLFARFSARLTGLENFDAGCGDAYAPAEDRTFDRIVAHPPYVPVLQPTWIYHGGGVDGETVTRKLVEGLPKHLAPGGRFLCRCVGTDRDGQNFELRIRSWLGDAESDFDVALYAIEAINPVYYITTSVLRGRSSQADLPKWHRAFEEAKILRFVSCFFVVQRRAAKRDVFTVRRDQGPKSGPRELEWLLQWETLRHDSEIVPRILNTPLRAAPGASLRSFHAMEDGAWALENQMLVVRHPFQLTWPIEPWAASLLPYANGSRTGSDLHRLLLDADVIHSEVSPAEFAAALAEMVAGGFLIIDGFEPPAPRA